MVEGSMVGGQPA